jgi:lipopolysaccharide export system protein LptC
MSELARQDRVLKRRWAAPGGAHDHLVRLLKIVLPVLVGLLFAYLFLAPLADQKESSFLLDKNQVDRAGERLRVQQAQYRGQDDLGRPFLISARSAVQATSAQPVIDIEGMLARINLEDGPASLTANQARYNMEAEVVNVAGPILFEAADGYRLHTSDVTVNLNNRTLSSAGRVEGRMPLGRFSADRLTADLAERRVVLAGRARLHILQGALR